ncbi:MAG: type II secretion system F family protein [Pseudomonadota bacterium]
MLFIYRARDPEGALITGEMEGEDAKWVKLRLADQGLYPVYVAPKGFQLTLPSFLQRTKKAKTADLINFTRQFGALFKAGIPINRTLIALYKQVKDPYFKKVVHDIQKDVMGGASLKEAFGKHPNYFDELYVNMLNVGEQGGVLDKSLNELFGILKREHRVKAAVKSATLYPRIVLITFTAVFVLMMVYVIPGFASFYAGFGAELPLPTRILMGISDVLVHYGYIVLLVGFFLFFVFKKYAATQIGGYHLDQVKLNIPVFGKLQRLVLNARFGHLVSSLYRSGLPIGQTLSIVANTVGNKVLKLDIDDVNSAVEKGSSLAAAMERKKYFDTLLVESAAVGEQSGSLDDMLETTSDFYDEEIDHMLGQLTTLIEPLLLFGLFAMVALLAAAIFLPMWGVAKVVLPSV